MAGHAALKRKRSRPRAMGQVFASIADYTYDWESWVDARGDVRWINPAVERMTGYAVAECLAMADYPAPLVHPEDRAVVNKALRAAARRRSGNDLEFRVLHRSGDVRWGAISWQSVYDGRRRWLGYRTSVRDISNRKEYELRLLQAKQEAEHANRTRGEFLAMMSHELRSPIQCIAGYARLLGRARLPERQRGYVDIISQQNEALLKTVDDLLELSSLQGSSAPALDMTTFAVEDVARRAVLGIRPQARKKRLRLASRVSERADLSVVGDPHRLGQILANLLGNAVKFTISGSVSLTVDLARADGDRAWLSFAVRDTGIGIAPDIQAKLFQPFIQGDASIRRRFGGTGLGLALSRRLADLMGGRIDVQSEPDRGSLFTLTIPFERAHAARTRQPPRGRAQVSPRARKLSVLVVEDSHVASALLREMLRLLGCRADCVDSGAHAVALHRKKRFDVIFMDVQMPGSDGLSVTRAIRAVPNGSRRPPLIVAVTANVLAEDRRACLAAGMDRFLGKPVSLEGLRDVLKDARARAPVPPVKSALRPLRVPAAFDRKVVRALLGTTMASGRSAFTHFGGQVAALLPVRLRELRDALRRGDARAPALLHDIAGHAAMMGARAFAEQARRAEARLRDGAVLSARELDRLARAAEHLVRWLDTVVQSSEHQA